MYVAPDMVKKVSQNKKEVKKIMRTKRWCLTVHGGTEEQLKKLKDYFETDKVLLAVVAFETGAHSIHPHWQCYYELKECISQMKFWREILGDNFHLEAARGTQKHNLDYCYAVNNKPYEIGLIRYSKGHEVPVGYIPDEANFITNFKPRSFQQQIIDICDAPPDERTIYWFYEEEGATGKSVLTRYLHVFYGAVVLTGRATDMKCALARVREIAHKDPTVVLVDLARVQKANTIDTVSCIEQIKNKIFFSGKYESTMIHSRTTPTVIIFSNRPPDPEIFSQDRWSVWYIGSPPLYQAKRIPTKNLESVYRIWIQKQKEKETKRKILNINTVSIKKNKISKII